MFEEVDLDAHVAGALPPDLSGGQRQRVGIARALMLSPEFIVADEPMRSLDVSVQAQVLNLLKTIQETRRLSILLISHDMVVVRSFCDRVAVMHAGRLVETAPTAALFARPLHEETRRLMSTLAVEAAG